jgi:hypothetical protein
MVIGLLQLMGAIAKEQSYIKIRELHMKFPDFLILMKMQLTYKIAQENARP